MLQRLFPSQADNRYRGYRLALWVLGALLLLKLVISVNSILNARKVASGADGIALDRLDAGTADTVLLLFRSVNLGQFMLVLIGLLVLVRYRALVPLLFLLLLFEQTARRLLLFAYPIPRADAGPIGSYINLGILALLLLGFALSLTGRNAAKTDGQA